MRHDLVIVGMGSGGMVAAELAATMGLRVAVVERGRVGGDCLWTGCVPSKALLASAKVAHHVRTAADLGLPAQPPLEIDTATVWQRIRAVQDQIASTDDDPDRYRSLGVELVEGDAELLGPHTVGVGQRRLETRKILLCTGSRAFVPDVAGLSDVGFVTTEDLFERDGMPLRVLFLGGGPIAVELAQGLARLGLQVAVLQRDDGILPRDEPELVDLLRRRLEEEGVDIQLGVDVKAATNRDGAKVLTGTQHGVEREWVGDEIVVATGRRPNVEGLGCEALGIEVGRNGIVVDAHLRTSVPSIYAAGDVVGRYRFTHAAAHEAVVALRDMFFPGRGRPSDQIPWCTFTDPELAHVGLTVAEAQERHGDAVEVHRISLDRSDRARADGSEGLLVLVTVKGRLVGGHLLAATAGEMVHEVALAIDRGLRLRDLARVVHVYPTLSTSIAQLAAEEAFGRAQRFSWMAKLGRLWP